MKPPVVQHVKDAGKQDNTDTHTLLTLTDLSGLSVVFVLF